jgi:serine/threonine protein kinase
LAVDRQRFADLREGEIRGTPAYMAPEQARGRHQDIGPATDIYGLGAILYELLTGRPPLQAASVVEILQQVMEKEPESPRRLNANIDRKLEAICLKCLNKDPGQRYASASELAADLHRFGNGLSKKGWFK